MSLYSLTLENIYTKLPETIIDDLRMRTINKYFGRDSKKVKIIVGIDVSGLSKITPYDIYSLFYKTVPDLFTNSKNVDEYNLFKNTPRYYPNEIDVVSVIDEYFCSKHIFDKNQNKYFNFDKFLKKNTWCKISQKMHDAITDDELRKFFTFCEVREDSNIIETNQGPIISFVDPDYCVQKMYKISEYKCGAISNFYCNA